MRKPSAKLEAAISTRWSCDPESGRFYRDGILYAVKPTTIKNRQYIHLNIAGVKVRAHRLMWRLCCGEWPVHDIDHINGDSLDNRLANLRDVPNAVNAKNKSPRKARSLPVGIYKKGSAYVAEAWDGGRQIRGKHRKTVDEAIADRVQMLLDLEFTQLHVVSCFTVQGVLHPVAAKLIGKAKGG